MGFHFTCQEPVWDGDDFSTCAQDKYIGVLFPGFVILISACLLIPSFRTLCQYLRPGRSRHISLGGDDTIRAVPETGGYFPENSRDDNSQLYRLRTTEESDYISPGPNSEYIRPVGPGRSTSHANDHFLNLSGICENDSDVDITFISSRGVTARAAVERGSLIALVIVHLTVTAAALLVKHARRESRASLVVQSLVVTIFWLYCFVLSLFRSTRVSNDIAFTITSHLAVIYFLGWSIAVIRLRSLFFADHVEVVAFAPIVDLIICSILCYIALVSPLGNVQPHVESRKGLEPSREPLANMYSFLTFSWIQPIVWKGYFNPLTLDDLWDLSSDRRPVTVIREFRSIRGDMSFVRACVNYLYVPFIVSCIWTFLYALTELAPVVLVKLLLEYTENPGEISSNMAWLYVVLLFVVSIADAIFTAQSLWGFRKMAIKIRSLLIGEIYAKALKRKAVATAEELKQPTKTKLDETADDVSSTSNTNKDDTNKSSTAPQSSITMGAVINLMAVDAIRISDSLANLNQLVKGLTMIIAAFILLYRNLGLSALVGMATMFLILPINYAYSKGFAKIDAALMAVRDERTHKTNEILQSIKIIKFFAWEDMFKADLLETRKKELRKLRQQYLLWAAAVIVWFGFPTVLTCVTFGFYTLVEKKELTASVAFSSIALFNLVRTPMDRLAQLVADVIDTKVSLDRIHRFMVEETTDKYDQLTIPRGPNSPCIGFENATLTWGSNENSQKFGLRNLNIDFKVGEITLVIGPTGAGKTSLLMGLLGEMTLLEGNIFLPGVSGEYGNHIDPDTGLSNSVAYCSQQPWLLNDSIKNNILFGSPYDHVRYQACIDACALRHDLEIFEAGDNTEVGEKGIALSGGQKQRISLARALYSQAKHLLLDDCLSAVDSHSALWIYQNCILGPLMYGRTCILVSHNVALTVVGANYIVVLNNGTVLFQGTPEEAFEAGVLGDDELLQQSISTRNSSMAVSRNVSSADLVSKHTPICAPAEESRKTVTDEVEVTESILDDPGEQSVCQPKNQPPPLVQAEESEIGQVKFDVYLTYFRNMGPIWYWLIVVLAFVGQQGGLVFQSWWIREWANNASDVSDEIHRAASHPGGHGVVYYLWIYAAISVIYMIISFCREGVVFIGSLVASRQLFEQLLQRVLRGTPRFFDSTPVGRILNRFSKDIEIVDQEVAGNLLAVMHSIVALAIILILITSILPRFLFAAVLICLIYYVINIFYLRSSRELKRIQSTTRSPIYQHFGETLAGLSTIRAYACEKRFMYQNLLYIETNLRPYTLLWACNRWMCLLVQSAGGLVATFAGVFVVLSQGSIDAGLAGLCLTYAITFSENMLYLVMLYAVTEMDMNSVERINEYLQIAQEAPEVVEYYRPPVGWPSKGGISVRDLSLRYAPELPAVIRNVSFDVKPGWKIGIVGRTGAGKSTIASAFFRFLEPLTGTIIIDDIDISKIGLRDLREALTIIPQDPTLFSGTIRSNLDPFNRYTDSAIFEALHRVHLIDNAWFGSGTGENHGSTSATDDSFDPVNVFYNLASPITEGGTNLSQGQRQLMCLARSLLKSPRVIILDEATASIDYETDTLLQKTIREEFKATTILTIAHRLRSIIDYDMILVMDAGTVKEYDKPHLLLQKKDSIFRAMCESSGELQTLAEMAEKAYKQQTGVE
ncbi:P-loop containing nucleoside triphosphate hydrolase protein [Lipomyces kononenkoae]